MRLPLLQVHPSLLNPEHTRLRHSLITLILAQEVEYGIAVIAAKDRWGLLPMLSAFLVKGRETTLVTMKDFLSRYV